VDDDDRPPLTKFVWEEVEKSLHTVRTTYSNELSELKVPHPVEPRSGGPTPPRLPEHLKDTLCAYARQLFITEADYYPVSSKVDRWLSKLSERVTERVLQDFKAIDWSYPYEQRMLFRR
jgi:hypothetical protein